MGLFCFYIVSRTAEKGKMTILLLFYLSLVFSGSLVSSLVNSLVCFELGIVVVGDLMMGDWLIRTRVSTV